MREYTNFKDIDRDLKILKLQTKIDSEEIKLTIDEVKDSLSPLHVLGNAASALVQKALVLKAVGKIIGVKRT
ncbi:DUF6327 family protein [Zunongwangia endophytica]|uniref:DUF6327 family protein n=1 Tax=Zunongwangia endophytica TaxID=1808945 RepID=A0ABV8H3C6_9FLAO|nr:DUF6327 family protein [Zunongwangia endophytica]MDN3595917.1 DUF6327 family protein [Zunongwangia endophytica]